MNFFVIQAGAFTVTFFRVSHSVPGSSALLVEAGGRRLMHSGDFKLDDGVIAFKDLAFGVNGADVSLNGSYDLDGDTLDFRGALKLQARVSQTMTGWKRWLLKPVDPFFAKNGAGTFLKIKVVGSSKAPKFGAGS